MIFYLDTSLLVAAMVREAHTPKAQAWLQAHATDDLAISEWVTTELSAALSIKLREKQIAAAQRAAALATFARLSDETFSILPVSGRHFRAAARLADQHALKLRAADALHLAVCAEHAATLCTLDRRLGKAGPPLGVPTTAP